MELPLMSIDTAKSVAQYPTINITLRIFKLYSMSIIAKLGAKNHVMNVDTADMSLIKLDGVDVVGFI
jgi:hypothetical protein